MLWAVSGLWNVRERESGVGHQQQYGRTVAREICAGADSNAAMVRSDMAWAYTRYLTDPQIQAIEVVARRERLGLWADADPVPPWEWRKASAKGS